MRLIDADALLEKLAKTPRYFTVKFDIEEQPTVDATPIIRCKDCAHFDPDDEDGLCCSETNAMLWPDENDYCSYGQRKDQSADVRKKEDVPDAAEEAT